VVEFYILPIGKVLCMRSFVDSKFLVRGLVLDVFVQSKSSSRSGYGFGRVMDCIFCECWDWVSSLVNPTVVGTGVQWGVMGRADFVTFPYGNNRAGSLLGFGLSVSIV
jgi:hypothetical protein